MHNKIACIHTVQFSLALKAGLLTIFLTVRWLIMDAQHVFSLVSRTLCDSNLC